MGTSIPKRFMYLQIIYLVNFCVAGNAITWYWVKKDIKNSCFTPYQKLLTKHWGSVVGGSFINAFL